MGQSIGTGAVVVVAAVGVESVRASGAAESPHVGPRDLWDKTGEASGAVSEHGQQGKETLPLSLC